MVLHFHDPRWDARNGVHTAYATFLQREDYKNLLAAVVKDPQIMYQLAQKSFPEYFALKGKDNYPRLATPQGYKLYLDESLAKEFSHIIQR